MHKGNTKDTPSPAKSPQGKPPAPTMGKGFVMPESSTPGAPRQVQNTHHALHTAAPNPTPTHKPERHQQKRRKDDVN